MIDHNAGLEGTPYILFGGLIMDKVMEHKPPASGKKVAIVLSVILVFAILTAIISIVTLNVLPARSVETTYDGGSAVPDCSYCDARTHETFWTWMACYFERHWQSSMWRLSQVFAMFAWIFSVWSWQMKDKVKCLFLVGMFSWLLVVSAALLGNWTLAILFGLAAVRNFVFCYFDWRGRRGRVVERKWYVVWAWIFATSTFGSTIFLVHILQVPNFAIWLEWLICITLLGLIIGNILQGTALMRWSFIFNRVFNIINHAYFANVIAVFIAVAAILSNLLFFARMAIEKARMKKEIPPTDLAAENT